MIARASQTYDERAARFGAAKDRCLRRARNLSNARMVVFAVLLVLGLLVERRPTVWTVAPPLAGLVLFAALIAAHRRTRNAAQWHAELERVNREGLHRLDRDWARLPIRIPDAEVSGHAWARDLDLYGPASLMQILGPVGSAAGAATLDRWLLEGAAPDTIRPRQEAVRELAGLPDLRDTFAVHARRTADAGGAELERFLQWAESPGWLHGRTLLHLLSWLLPAATWLLLAAHLSGFIGSSLWLVPMAASLVLYFTAGTRMRRTFDSAFGRETLFAEYPRMMELITSHEFRSPLLRTLTAGLGREQAAADRQIAALHRLMHLADVRTSSMHLPLFIVSLWDVHVLRALERWQRRSGDDVRQWLAALGAFEALCALATLAHDQPDWTFAEFTDAGEPPLLEADALGHPLIADEERVPNDVRVGPPGTFLLVTGSNMSGKSTLLRALGTNVVLARAGAPSCARRLRLPPVLDVQTSIRIQDSLARGVSYFMAELERLKQIVDAAERARRDPNVTVLFLLDEILHGTNTAERRIAARRVIRHLVDARAIGAVTTHDLELAAEPTLSEPARLVHFTESFADSGDGAKLTFDYRLRPGLATSTNALALMRMVGLPEDG